MDTWLHVLLKRVYVKNVEDSHITHTMQNTEKPRYEVLVNGNKNIKMLSTVQQLNGERITQIVQNDLLISIINHTKRLS